MSKKKTAQDFQFGSRIGEGSYSTVYKGVDIQTRKVFAIKVLSKKHIVKEKKIKYVNIEKITLNRLGRHPGIVTLYYTFQDDNSLYFVLDIAEHGELLTMIRKLGSLSENCSRYYMTQLVDAVDFMHKKGVIHRDLKPENILVNSEKKLMITDFGAAKVLNLDDQGNIIEDASTEEAFKKGSFVGTAEYVSPELLKFNKCGFESDIWAIGCILYQFIVGVPPFKGKTEYQTFEKIVGLQYQWPNFYIPDLLRDLVFKLLQSDPKDRLPMKNLQAHPWFNRIDWNDKAKIWGLSPPSIEPYRPLVEQTLNQTQASTQNGAFKQNKIIITKKLPAATVKKNLLNSTISQIRNENAGNFLFNGVTDKPRQPTNRSDLPLQPMSTNDSPIRRQQPQTAQTTTQTPPGFRIQPGPSHGSPIRQNLSAPQQYSSQVRQPPISFNSHNPHPQSQPQPQSQQPYGGLGKTLEPPPLQTSPSKLTGNPTHGYNPSTSPTDQRSQKLPSGITQTRQPAPQQVQQAQQAPINNEPPHQQFYEKLQIQDNNEVNQKKQPFVPVNPTQNQPLATSAPVPRSSTVTTAPTATTPVSAPITKPNGSKSLAPPPSIIPQSGVSNKSPTVTKSINSNENEPPLPLPKLVVPPIVTKPSTRPQPKISVPMPKGNLTVNTKSSPVIPKAPVSKTQQSKLNTKKSQAPKIQPPRMENSAISPKVSNGNGNGSNVSSPITKNPSKTVVSKALSQRSTNNQSPISVKSNQLSPKPSSTKLNAPIEVTTVLKPKENIIKLDYINESELVYSQLKTFDPTSTLSKLSSGSLGLDDVVINEIITRNGLALEQELKRVVLVITDFGFIHLFKVTKLDELEFYLSIDLTDKLFAMYDYEFSEFSETGYLILEVLKHDKLVFLSPLSRKVKRDLKQFSKIQLGSDLSWIDSLMKTKELLKNRTTTTSSSTTTVQPPPKKPIGGSNSPKVSSPNSPTISQSSSSSNSTRNTTPIPSQRSKPQSSGAGQGSGSVSGSVSSPVSSSSKKQIRPRTKQEIIQQNRKFAGGAAAAAFNASR